MENERLAEVHKDLQGISIKLGESAAFMNGGLAVLQQDIRTRQDRLMVQAVSKLLEGFAHIKNQIDEVIKKVEEVK